MLTLEPGLPGAPDKPLEPCGPCQVEKQSQIEISRVRLSMLQ